MMPIRLFSLPEEQARPLLCYLLERGASVKKPKDYPIIKAAQLGHLSIVQLLVAFGVDVTVRQNMALRVSAARNNTDMVKYFLEDLKIVPDSDTLKVCVQKGLWNMVKLLMEHGAIPDMSTVNYA
ncbi:hypothetical protein BDF14DRAFT_1742787 [Spinellus fusiger]|nr:hypothetical protein BDF14DRAFT_1742787 [Spinellus fusiger]